MLRHSIIYISSQVLAGGVAFVTTSLLTWSLIPAEYGIIGLGLAVSTLLANACFDWQRIGFLRFFVSHGATPNYLPTARMTFLMLCLATALLFPVVLATGLTRSNYALAGICLLGTWGSAWFAFVNGLQIADAQPVRNLRMNLARNLSYLVVAVATAYFSRSGLITLGAIYLAIFLSCLPFDGGGTWVSRSHFSRPLAAEIFQFAWPMIISSTLLGLSISFNRIMIEMFSDSEAVGFFTFAFTLMQNSLSMLAAGVASATYPAAVRAVESKSEPAIKAQLESNLTLMLALLLPGAVGLILLAPNMAAVLASPIYRPSFIAMAPWLTINAFVTGVRIHYFDHAFLLGRRSSMQMAITLVAAAINVGLNILWIPKTAFLGAAQAMAAAGVAGVSLSIVLGRRSFPMPAPWLAIGKVSCATGAMALAILPLLRFTGPIALVAQSLVGFAVYAGAALAMDILGVRQRLRTRLSESR